MEPSGHKFNGKLDDPRSSLHWNKHSIDDYDDDLVLDNSSNSDIVNHHHSGQTQLTVPSMTLSNIDFTGVVVGDDDHENSLSCTDINSLMDLNLDDPILSRGLMSRGTTISSFDGATQLYPPDMVYSKSNISTGSTIFNAFYASWEGQSNDNLEIPAVSLVSNEDEDVGNDPMDEDANSFADDDIGGSSLTADSMDQNNASSIYQRVDADAYLDNDNSNLIGSANNLNMPFTDDDVLCGRGAHNVHHLGNQRFLWERHNLYRQYHLASTNRMKKQLTEQLIQSVYESNGRFMEKVLNTRTNKIDWVETTNRKFIYRKASQAMREGKM